MNLFGYYVEMTPTLAFVGTCAFCLTTYLIGLAIREAWRKIRE